MKNNIFYISFFVIIFIVSLPIGISVRIDNLNVIETSNIQIVDLTAPTFVTFNQTNMTYFKGNSINLTYNITDNFNLNNSMRVYVNGIKNTTQPFRDAIFQNISINLSLDGNYSFVLEANDTAGNHRNSTIRNIVLDSKAPDFYNASNRTTSGSKTILDNTDVNISVFLNDTYPRLINFSYNISNGSWYNVSLDWATNSTLNAVISKNNLTAGMVGGWKFYAYDLAGNELDPIYTYTVGSSATTTTSSGGGGGDSSPPSFMTQTQLSNPFGEATTDGICQEGQQLFDNRCYACPSNGYLKFNPEDRSVLCIQCNAGYKLEGDRCVLLPPTSIKNQINAKIDLAAEKISSLFGTKNLLIGYFILVSGTMILAYYGLTYLQRRPNG